MNFSDISVVVQGPVQTFQDRPQEENITHKCLESVRKYLPGAKIILSTWPGQELDGLDFDQLVISEDPGVNVRNYSVKNKPQRYNNNRQIVSSRAGLEQVDTAYALKLRSDNYLTGNHFVQLQQEYQERSVQYAFLNERVVVSDIFTRRYAKGFPVAFHISDFFYFGRTEDVLALWSMPLFDEFQPTEEIPFNDGYPDFVVDCTQAIFLAAIQKFDPKLTLNSLLDNSKEKLLQSEKTIANNLIVAPPSLIGLGLCQKFLGKARVSRRSGQVAHLQFFEWEKWYQRHCDLSFQVRHYYINLVWLFLCRCRYVFPTRLQTKLKILKRKLQKDYGSNINLE